MEMELESLSEIVNLFHLLVPPAPAPLLIEDKQ